MLLADMIDSLLGNPVERPKYESLLADDRLAPRPKEKPVQLAPRPKEKPTPRGSLQDIAAMVGNDQKIPADFLVSNVLDPIAWHESYNYIENPVRNPGIAKGARMNPTQKQIGGGPGRGLFQIEGARGVNKKDSKGKDTGKPDSFDVAINRAKNYFGYKGLSVPSWINNIQDGTDAADLPADQQKALALLNFTRINKKRERIDTGLQKLYNDSTNNANYETAIKDFWSAKHHTRPSTKQKNDFMGSLKNISKKRNYLNIEADIE